MGTAMETMGTAMEATGTAMIPNMGMGIVMVMGTVGMAIHMKTRIVMVSLITNLPAAEII